MAQSSAQGPAISAIRVAGFPCRMSTRNRPPPQPAVAFPQFAVELQLRVQQHPAPRSSHWMLHSAASSTPLARWPGARRAVERGRSQFERATPPRADRDATMTAKHRQLTATRGLSYRQPVAAFATQRVPPVAALPPRRPAVPTTQRVVRAPGATPQPAFSGSSPAIAHARPSQPRAMLVPPSWRRNYARAL